MDDVTAAVADGVGTVVRNPLLVGVTAAVMVALAPVAVGTVGFATLAVGEAFVTSAAWSGDLVALAFGGLAGALLAALAVTFQFADVAVVVGGEGAVGALRESAGLARPAPLEVLGYSVTGALLAGVVLLPGVVVAVVAGRVHPDLAYAGWVVAGLLLPVAFAAATATHLE